MAAFFFFFWFACARARVCLCVYGLYMCLKVSGLVVV